MSSVILVSLEQAALLLISLHIELSLLIKKKILLNLFDSFHINNDLQKKLEH